VISEAIAGVLSQITGEIDIGPHTRLDADLVIDSLELAALGSVLAERYGFDLPALIAGLTLDEIIELSVADLARFVEAESVKASPA
jgi:acyl carrier protein